MYQIFNKSEISNLITLINILSKCDRKSTQSLDKHATKNSANHAKAQYFTNTYEKSVYHQILCNAYNVHPLNGK